jgi:signal transduction histidine kinase
LTPRKGKRPTPEERRARGAIRQEEQAIARKALSSVERSKERLQHLYDIGKLLLRFTSIERTTREVLELVGKVVPVVVGVLLLDDRGRDPRTRLLAWRADDVVAPRLREATTHARTTYGYLSGATTTWDLDTELAGACLPRPGPRRPGRVMKPGRPVVLPLVEDKGRVFGVLLLEGRERLDETDLKFLNGAVSQLAVALQRAAMVSSQQAQAEARREAAEAAAFVAGRAEHMQRFLSGIGARLGASLSAKETLATVAASTVPSLADVCLLDELTVEGELRRAEVAVADERRQELVPGLRAVQPGPDSPQARVARSGQSLLLDGEELAVLGCDPAVVSRLFGGGSRTVVVVPLAARGHVLGTLTLMADGAEQGRRYSPADLHVAEEIGRRAAWALDNARLYEASCRATDAREELLAVVAHDLRAPLGTILLTATSLIEEAALTPVERKTVERMASAVQAMGRLLADLLDLASLDAGRLSVEPAPEDAESLVQEALEQARPLAVERGLHLLAGPPLAAPCGLSVDRGRILQVFGNLLGNAMKFTPRGGTITVGAARLADGVELSVADTGPGIAPADLPRVFDRYWQAKRTARLGAGLGLSIARGLVEAHGGRLRVESAPGAGATFAFTLSGSASTDPGPPTGLPGVGRPGAPDR